MIKWKEELRIGRIWRLKNEKWKEELRIKSKNMKIEKWKEELRIERVNKKIEKWKDKREIKNRKDGYEYEDWKIKRGI
jgi:hypothetical protein